MSKIINIAGTSGSGKSTAARALIEQAEEVSPAFKEGQRAPIGYEVRMVDGQKFFLLGAYEAPTGGCDTIKKVEEVFDLVRERAEAGQDVVYEGLFVMNMTRGPQLAGRLLRAGHEYHVMLLTTPLEECLAGINARRAASGKGPLENLKNTEGNYKRAKNYAWSMKTIGAARHLVSRDEVVAKVLEVLS